MRSKRSGLSTGLAYVKFDFPEVAEIAAESMDKYMMFGTTLRCCVKTEEWEAERPNLFSNVNTPDHIRRIGEEGFVEERDKRLQKRKSEALEKSRCWSREDYVKKCYRMVEKDKKLSQKIKDLGIDYTYPVLELDPGVESEYRQYETKKGLPSYNREASPGMYALAQSTLKSYHCQLVLVSGNFKVF